MEINQGIKKIETFTTRGRSILSKIMLFHFLKEDDIND